MSHSRKGWPDLAGLTVIAVLSLTFILIIIVIIEAGIYDRIAKNVLGIEKTVNLDILPIDRGTKLNSFLLLERRENFYGETIGLSLLKKDDEMLKEIAKTLDVIDMSLLVLSDGQEVFRRGDVREGQSNFVDFPLAGKKRGKLGVDSE